QSAAYARAAEGDVLIFVRCGNDPIHNPGSVLWTTELPTLLQNPNVTSITAYDSCCQNGGSCGSCINGFWCNPVTYR
ncbi:MAG: hypothetical protein WB554_00770, partial [Desulfomonilaceae bacterium]